MNLSLSLIGLKIAAGGLLLMMIIGLFGEDFFYDNAKIIFIIPLIGVILLFISMF